MVAEGEGPLYTTVQEVLDQHLYREALEQEVRAVVPAWVVVVVLPLEDHPEEVLQMEGLQGADLHMEGPRGEVTQWVDL